MLGLFSSESGLLRGKTRVLVSHALHYMENAKIDEIFAISDGKIVARGSYQHLKANGLFQIISDPETPSQEIQPEIRYGMIIIVMQ